MTVRPRSARRPPLITAVLCVLATVAVAVTVPVVLTRRQTGRSDSGQLAPGLAALTDEQLSALVPTQSNFPGGWTPTDTPKPWDDFGYSHYHEMRGASRFRPPECSQVSLGLRTGSFGAAAIAEHDPAGSSYLFKSTDLRVEIGREFNESVFDEMAKRVPVCSHFVDEFASPNTVRIIEDLHPAAGPLILRYSVTSDLGTDYYSYARLRGLIVTGEARHGHRELLDTVFTDTLNRIKVAPQS